MQQLKFVQLFICASLTVISTAQAETKSGADILLNTVERSAPSNPGAVNANPSINFGMAGIKLDDAFVMQLFSQWQVSKPMPYHVQLWLKKIFEKDYRGAAHLWSQVKGSFTDEFALAGQATYVYLLWKLNLAQSFWNHWLDLLAIEKNRKEKIVEALTVALEPGFAQWFLNTAILTTPEQNKLILEGLKNEPNTPVLDTVRAWVLLRTGITSQADAMLVLNRMSPEHPLKIPFSQTLALGYARVGQLGQAGQILKNHLEPAIQKSGKVEALSGYYLQIARLLYQADALDAAEDFYRRIPNSRPEFATAREELTWILLRKNDAGSLKGELKNFKLGLLEDKFLPEALVVSAIINLKLCSYKQVQDDFANFVRIQKQWANRIEAQMNSMNPERPQMLDFFVDLGDRSLRQRTQETELLKDLAKESINAALPAVGVQHHWEEEMQTEQIALEVAKKFQLDEYRRVWRNRGLALKEAIQKMKFVKVELLSQLSQLAATGDAAKQQAVLAQKKLAVNNDSNTISFPFDGVVWNDELFHLQSLTEGVCL